MPAIAGPESEQVTEELEVFFYNVESADGTRLRAWTNDPDHQIDGPTVLLCNGLGTNAWTMPALLRPDCGVRVISWNHRGVGGSDRPSDPERVGIEEFVEDALAVLTDAGVESATLMGWSMGVNTAFEFALRHPERVDGIFAVAGVPGDTFRTMLAPLRLPHPLARALTVNAARLLKHTGRLLTPVTTRLPVGARAIWLVGHTGFMFPPADPEMAARAVREFLTTPIEWYFHLGLKTSEHARVSLSQIKAPVMLVAGKWDILAGARDMYTAAERLQDATYVELPATHFVAMEQPEAVHDLLLEFLERVG
jgi:pimeloyl-ACP methyl ester carboxylesterase